MCESVMSSSRPGFELLPSLAADAAACDCFRKRACESCESCDRDRCAHAQVTHLHRTASSLSPLGRRAATGAPRATA